MYKLPDNALEILLKDKPELLGACLNAIYQDLDSSQAAEDFHRRHMTPSCGVITVYDTEGVKKIMAMIADKISEKMVIEVGAGVGLLAIAMASMARRVYAIESDPAWSWAFTKILYDIKQPNLTFIFGTAESMVGILKADVAVIVTHSGHKEMRAIAKQLAPEVIDVYEEKDKR
jgi:protein-L-isoaspartate O-methyltransferase